MIEQDVLLYLKGYATLTALIPATSIYLIQAPTEAKMPFLVVENIGGMREQIAHQLSEESTMVRLYVDCGPSQYVAGRAIMQAALKGLENFRGKMYNANDMWMSCSSIRGFAGLSGTYRYVLDCNVKFTEAMVDP